MPSEAAACSKPADSSLDFDKLAPDVRRDLRALCRTDNYHAPLALTLDYAVVAASVYLCVGISYWFFPLAAILIGSTQRALVNILHESSHKVLARNRTLNVVLGTIFSGYLVLHLYNPYRNTHIGFHHRFLGDADRDPDYKFHVECGLYETRHSNRIFFTRNILLAVLGFRTPEYLRYVVRDRLMFRSDDLAVSMPVSLRVERPVFFAQWAILVGGAAAFGWLDLLLLFWVVPMVTAAVAIGWLSELAEHYPLPESENKRVLMTRNRHGWAIERFLLGRHHDNYHLVHHLNTGVPFWNLKKAHAALLRDPGYARWDALWAGILTRAPGRSGQETLVSYARKYRTWRGNGGDPASAEVTFAESMVMTLTPPPLSPAARAEREVS
jgi:fatty acid desaturase